MSKPIREVILVTVVSEARPRTSAEMPDGSGGKKPPPAPAGASVPHSRGPSNGKAVAELNPVPCTLELRVLAEGQTVSLDQFLLARRAADARYNTDTAARIEAQKLLPQIEKSCRGPDQWEDTYFTRYVTGAALLVRTKHEEVPGKAAGKVELVLRVRYPPEAVASLSPRFERAIWKCTSMARHGHSPNLGEGDRAESVRMLYSLVVYLLGVLDAQCAPHKGLDEAGKESRLRRVDEALETAEREIRRVEAFLDDAGRRIALRRYIETLPVGIALAIGLGLLFRQTWGPSDRSLVVGIFTAGGLGAVVSVMWRITSGDFAIDDRAGRLSVWLSGLFRAPLGALFGLALFVLVASNIMPTLGPTEDVHHVYFYYTLSFLAGFSERFAPDAFGSTERSVSGRAASA